MKGDLSTQKIEELLSLGYESDEIDFKENFNKNSLGCWMNLAKDVYGFSNFGGGYIVIGVEDGTFKLIGLKDFHVDVEELIEKFSKWATKRVSIKYKEYKKNILGEERIFPVLYVEGANSSPIITKTKGEYEEEGKKKTAFLQNTIYIRKESSTKPISSEDYPLLFWDLVKRSVEYNSSKEVPLEVINELGRKKQPDKVDETLWFNLFPVTEIPDLIYFSETNFRTPKEIYDQLAEQEIPTFLLEDKKIYTFKPLDNENILSSIIDSKVNTIKAKEWLDDPVKNKKLIKLLNFHLKKLSKNKGFFYDAKKDRYFFRYYGTKVPEITWKPYAKTTKRQLVLIKQNSVGEMIYCEHFGAKMRFILLNNLLFLLVEPVRVLTKDGIFPLDSKRNTRISTKINRYYHNNNYLYDVKLCLHILAGSREEILFEENPKLVVSTKSLKSIVNFGISEDQHTQGDFLDLLISEPLEYIIYEDMEEIDTNPLTDDPLEELE